MAQTEGEKEIVLGNKQLISLFFVVVALMGICMAAGYMIGRKSVTPGSAGSSVTDTQTAAHQESEPPRETAAESTPAQTMPAQSASTPAPLETAPVRTQPPVETVPERKEPAEYRAAEKPVRNVAAKAVDADVTKPEAGATYLQVTALRHPDCDNLVRSLREQNFPATLASSSKEGLFRVLVGPYHETAKVADAKLRLKALGFANAFVQR